MFKRIKKMFSFDGTDKILYIALACLIVFGSLMIFSAEMGNALSQANVDNPYYFPVVIGKQLLFIVLGIMCMMWFASVNIFSNKKFYMFIGGVLFFALAICRAFGSIGGAYAWIRTPIGTLQPAEFVKVFMIVAIARFSVYKKNDKEENFRIYKNLIYLSLIFVIFIFGYQHDTGTAVVLAGICYLLLMLPENPKCLQIEKWLFRGLILIILLILFVMTPMCTNILESLGSSSYMIGRFLAAANPFKYQYNIGYHLVMSLVAFATGGIKGLGYGQSTHKYMNFPNPENDFILPIIIEELGITGMIIIVVLYGLILGRLIHFALSKKADVPDKIILLGVSLYFILHFILNVGGVTGLIPLTGVPLLMISSGGTSWVAAMSAIGFAQNSIRRIKGRMEYEDNRG